MEEKILIKSVLEGYHFLDKIVKKLDSNVMTKSVNSYHTQSCAETLNLANDVLKITERKHKLLCLKQMIEECVKMMPQEYSKVIALRYLDCFKLADIAKMLEIGIKKVSRTIDKAIIYVSRFFSSKGFDFVRLSAYLQDENWLLGIYGKHLNFSNKYAHKNFVMNYV